MSIKPEIKEAMKRLGFSDYNIIIYETLLREKELDARILSQKTKVPYSRVYEILNEMIEKGFIVKLDGRPSTYTPKSPIDVLQGIQEQYEREFRDNSNLVKEPLMSLFSEQRSAQTTQMTITYGRPSNVVHMKNLIKNAVRSVSIVLVDFDVIFPEILDELRLLKLKHAKAQMIVPEGHDDEIEPLREMIEMKVVAMPAVNLVVTDDTNVLFISAGDYLKNVSEDMIGVSMVHASTSFIARKLFENLWSA